MEPIILTIRDGVAWLRFNRPDCLNALDAVLATRFHEVVSEVVADPKVQVMVLTGEGRAFVAGGDLLFLHDAPDRADAARALIQPMHDALKKLAGSHILVVAAVNGVAAGAGMSLALMADFVVAARSAVFSMAYLSVAASPDCGGSWALSRQVGPRKATELALLGERLTADAAAGLGLVNVVTDDLEGTTVALTERLVRLPRGATARTRALIRSAPHTDLCEQLDLELEAFVTGARSSEFADALNGFVRRRL